ncbi:MAG: cysteine-rich CWC family protein [Tepidisphaeraceae bacterium]
MPLRTLRFCRKCLVVRQTATPEVCERCDSELLLFLDESGAISRDYLVARGTCCDFGCRNCPYKAAAPAGGKCATGVTEKNCPKCGAGFECQSGQCWCESVPLSPDALKWLRRTYVGCLCPTCLAEISAA